MKTRGDFFVRYLELAPLPLAIERTMECRILSKQVFIRPVLDIGIGEGLFAEVLFEDKVDVGLDPQARELARALEFEKYDEIIHGYGHHVPKPNGFFRTILSNSVMEHIRDIEPVLKEAHRVLAPDGVMYLTLPTEKFDQYSVVYRLLGKLSLNSWQERYRRFFNIFWAHYHACSIKDWKALFERNGFRVLEHQQYCPKDVAILNNFLAPFSILAYLQKRVWNRWFLVESLRRPLALLYARLFSWAVVDRCLNVENGGIVFFKLAKNEALPCRSELK